MIKLLIGTILFEFKLSQLWICMANSAIAAIVKLITVADWSNFDLSLLLWGKFARFEK